jgi:serine/threonine protein kinase
MAASDQRMIHARRNLEMKLIMENWNRFINEDVEQPVEKIKQIVSNNVHLKHLVPKINEKTIKDLGNIYYLQFPDGLNSDHIKKHFDKNSSASIFSISQDQVADLMLSIMKKNPTRSVTEREILKHKWLNIPTDSQVGFDSLKKLDPNDPSISIESDLDPFLMTKRVKDWNIVSKVAKDNDYELVTSEGRPYTEQDLANDADAFIKQEIGVIPGRKEDNPTKLMNIVVAQIGEVDGKPVTSLMSVYPGHQPVDEKNKDLTNKKDFKEHGYYFVKG